MNFFSSKTAAELAADNPVVPVGEIWAARDTGAAKRGTGAPWLSLLPWPAGQTSYLYKRTDQASTDGTDLTDVTWLTFPIVAGGVYIAEYTVFHIAAATTTGIVLSVNGPAEPTTVKVTTFTPLTATTFATGTTEAFDTVVTATASISATVPQFSTVSAFVANGATAGTLALRFRTEVADSAVTIEAGSWAKITRVG